MNIAKRSVTLTLAVALTTALAATLASAEDWPQWRGPNRDAKVADFKPPATWPATLTEKWKATVGLGDAPPAVVGDKVYVFTRQGNNEVTLCLDAATGKELWKESVEAPAVTGAASGHAGPRSSPAVADGKVVTLGVAGTLSCVNAADGKLLWRKNDIKGYPQFYTSFSPVIVDGLAIAHLGGPRNGEMVAYDLTSGEVKWKWTGDAPAYASPAVMTIDGVKQIVSQTNANIVGLGAADGKLLWSIPFAPTGRAYNAPTPLIDGATVIYCGQGRGTHAVKITKEGDKFTTKELWVSDVSPLYATPVLSNGFIFGLSDKGALYCLSAADGKTAWTDDSKKPGQYAGLVAAGDIILALPSTSTLIAFKATDKAYTEVASIKVSDTPTFAYLVVTANKLLVKDKEKLLLLGFE